METHNLEEVLKGEPQWTAAGGAAAFWLLQPFNGGSSWIGRFSGTSPWELHPDGDELLYLLEGETQVEVLTDDGPASFLLRPGSTFVVPRGHWHRHVASGPVLELGATSGRTERSFADDPSAPRPSTPPPGTR